jgi:AcrR family transcriptional regulator
MQRRYVSPLRAEQTRRTRLAIIEAALRLFLANGYAGTSIRSIASEAGVSERTVYVAFGDKISIITAIADHERFGGTEEGEGEAQFLESLRAVAHPLERLRMAVHQMAIGREHGLAMIARIVRGEARSNDPGLRQFVDGMVEYRHQGTRGRVELILGHPLPDGPGTEQLVDEVEAILNEETYLLLVGERGWPLERYETYIVDMFLLALQRYGIAIP